MIYLRPKNIAQRKKTRLSRRSFFGLCARVGVFEAAVLYRRRAARACASRPEAAASPLPRLSWRAAAAVVLAAFITVQTAGIGAFEAHVVNVKARIVDDGVMIAPAGGGFCGDEPVLVTITSALPGAAIIYTLDGSEPLCGIHGLAYAGEFYLAQSAIVSARACHDGRASAVLTAEFVLAPEYCGAYCGNGVVDPGEECDGEAGIGEHQACRDCALIDLTYCGNGTVESPNDEGAGGVNNDGYEACDDGNRADGDGCSANCVIEQLGPYCGDGEINQDTEECDDGNSQNNDGCSSLCRIETPTCMKINEVYYDPGVRTGPGGSVEGDPADEWIELYNACSYEVNLKDWKLADNNDEELLNHNYPIAAGQFVVIAANASTWSYWPNIPDNAFKIALGGTRLFNGLSNSGDRVLLYDAGGELIDAVSWGTDTTAFAPAVGDVDEGHSISRAVKGVDTDAAVDWMDTYGGSTPPGPNPGTNPHDAAGGLIFSEDGSARDGDSPALAGESLDTGTTAENPGDPAVGGEGTASGTGGEINGENTDLNTDLNPLEAPGTGDNSGEPEPGSETGGDNGAGDALGGDPAGRPDEGEDSGEALEEGGESGGDGDGDGGDDNEITENNI